MTPRFPILAVLCWMGCADGTETACAKGYGMDASGACVAVAEDGTSPATTEPGPTDTAQPEDSGEPATLPDHPAWEEPLPEWSPAEVETQLNDLLGLGVPHPLTMFTEWQSMFVGADPWCPGGEGDYYIGSTASGCLSESGWFYAGMASYREMETELGPVHTLSVDGYIISPDSGTFIGGGHVGLIRIQDGDAKAWMSEVEGSWGLDTSLYPWLAQAPSTALYADGGVMGADREARFTGGWTVADRAIFLALSLDSACEGMSGTAFLRDPSGPWHALDLDCGSCGPVRYADGPSEGEICMDLEPLLVFVEAIEATL